MRDEAPSYFPPSNAPAGDRGRPGTGDPGSSTGLLCGLQPTYCLGLSSVKWGSAPPHRPLELQGRSEMIKVRVDEKKGLREKARAFKKKNLLQLQ